MVKVLRRKVVSEIRTSYLQYLSVILIAMLAVTLFTGIYANYKNFDDRLKHIYDITHMSDITITFQGYDEQDEEFLKSNHISYEKRIYLTGKSGTTNVNIIVFDENTQMCLPTQLSKENISTHDVLVDQNFLNRKELNIGDSVEVEVRSITFQATITGTMIHPEALDNSSYSTGLIYLGIDVLKDIGGSLIETLIPLLYNQYIIQTKNPSKTLKEIQNYYDQKETSNLLYAALRSDMPTNVSIESDVIQAKKMLYVFPVIFYLVAVLIILTSISQLINKEKMNIGIMKSFGYTKKEIMIHYMSIIILLCIIGSIFGMILGPLIIPKVMSTKYHYLYQLPKYHVTFFRFEYLISVFILILVSMFTSFIACKNEINKKPIESLRGENSVQMKGNIIEQTKLFQKIPLTIRMALRNMRRKISRTLMVVLGLIGCSSLLVCGFGIDNTLNYGLDLELNELISYDLSIGYLNSGSHKEELQKIDGITKIEEYEKIAITLQKDKIISSSLFLLPETSEVFTPNYQQEGVLLSEKVAEEIGAKVGDEINIVMNNQTYQEKVSSIVSLCITQGVFVSQEKMNLPFSPNATWIKTSDSKLNSTIQTQIENINGIESVITIQEMKQRLDSVTSSIRVMTTTVKVFAILLAIVVLYNLALLNFEERTRDIATLKVLGFNRIEIGMSLTFEILTSTLIGSLVGLLFGYPLLVTVLSINENPLVTYIYHIYPSTYLYTILLTCGVSIVMNSIFSFLTKRIRMVESLKSVD